MAGTKYQFDNMAIAIKVEAQSGTFVSPDVVLPIERGSGSPEPKFDTDTKDPYSAHKGSKETVIITQFSEVEYTLKMKLPANHTLIAPTFAMCGVGSSDIDGGKAYAFDSSSDSSCSIRWTEKRTTTEARGARADFEISAEVGKAVEINFNLKSVLNQVVDLANDVADNTIAPAPDTSSVFMDKNCTAYLINGATVHLSKVSLKLGGEVVVPKDTCPLGAYTKDIKPELTVSIPLTEENEGAYNDLVNGTEFNFVIPFFDKSGTKKWELIVPKCVATSQKKSESDRRLIVERTLECRKVAGDDNFELKAFD